MAVPAGAIPIEATRPPAGRPGRAGGAHGAVRCRPAAGIPTAVDVAIVDHTGAIGGGRLVAGGNPVPMTFEGVLERVV